jgi:hypothetical protein
MKLVADEKRTKRVDYQDMDNGTLFYDEDGDIAMKISGDECLCFSINEGDGSVVSFLRGPYFFEEVVFQQMFEPYTGSLTLSND